MPGKKLLRAPSSDMPVIMNLKAYNAAICTLSAVPLLTPSRTVEIAWPKTGILSESMDPFVPKPAFLVNSNRTARH